MIFPEFSIYLLIVLMIINILTFFIMFFDKFKSANYEQSRISEGLMFFLAAIGGSFGVYAGMLAFRHKTRKWYFLIGIPLLMIENFSTAYLINLFFFTN